MYYHVNVETTEQVGEKTKTNRQHFQLDSTDLENIKDTVVRPFLEGKSIQFDGYFLSSQEIKRIAIRRSEKSTVDLSQYENDNMSPGIIYFVSRENIFAYDQYMTDITQETFFAVKADLVTPADRSGSAPAKSKQKSKKVFIVHGRDNEAKNVAARFVERVKHEAMILHEQVSAGMTVIEKIEAHSEVDFAIVLYTPCDVGALVDATVSRPRARQNVVFEHGFLIAKLGRSKVCALVKGNVELPNDISGVVYIPMDDHGAWKFVVAKEMKQAGCEVDLNDI